MLLELWLAALRAEVGIAIPTDNRALLRQHLYKARAEAKNPELEQIVMIIPEQEEEIWLVHKDADADHTRSTRTDMLSMAADWSTGSNGKD